LIFSPPSSFGAFHDNVNSSPTISVAVIGPSGLAGGAIIEREK
jgi:hypothetical protein